MPAFNDYQRAHQGMNRINLQLKRRIRLKNQEPVCHKALEVLLVFIYFCDQIHKKAGLLPITEISKENFKL